MSVGLYLVIAFVVCTLSLSTDGLYSNRICVKYYGDPQISVNDDFDSQLNDDESDLKILGGGDHEICKRGINSCYIVWTEIKENNNTIVKIGAQGCWETSGRDCNEDLCTANERYPRKHLNTRFCCCSTNLCNFNVTFPPNAFDHGGDTSLQTPTRHPPPESLAGEKRFKLFVLSGCGVVVVLFLLVLIGIIRKWGIGSKDPKLLNSPQHLDHCDVHFGRSPQAPSDTGRYSMSNLKLTQVVGQGRYGTVWLATTNNDEQLAVKTFPFHYSQYYYNEKDIYTLPFMEHPSLLTYLGCDQVRSPESINFFLVLSYCPLGTLQDYLKNHTLSLANFCSMALTATAGLAHLHTEVRKGDKWKPCITHRDVNTKNILVKADMTCCICDLGLAVKITGSHYYTLDGEQHAETKSINDVGTLRYMAPEVLEGAVNLRDCESSLKQIDVYALGLVLWELSIRTHDFYNKLPEVPPYSLPFEKEVGLHPCLEQMQVVVCRNKARPLFPQEMKWNSATRLVRETVEDCTDQDGEARLTALCVQERLSQLSKGTALGGGTSPIHHNNSVSSAPADCNIVRPTSLTPTPMNFNHQDNTDGHSEGTVETIVTMSPSEPPAHLGAREYVITMHPHQGRNPCMERNLLSSSEYSDELCIVQTSSKHQSDRNLETESLICPTRRDNYPSYNPIPYLQNTFSQATQSTKHSSPNTSGAKPISTFFGKPLKKLLKTTNKSVKPEGRVIISPFIEKEETSSTVKKRERPCSLELNKSTLEASLDEELEKKQLKELSSRIKTPGDLPASVRKKRARLSLYDDRMMSSANSKVPLKASFDSSF